MVWLSVRESLTKNEISLRQELSDKESSLKSKYDAYSKELESDLIDAIIQVF